jgi:F-type H+-transporting ATPase subunit delta
MSVLRIATRYAKSLLDLAVEQGRLDAVQTDMVSIREIVKNPDLHSMLKSPTIPAEKKSAVMNALFAGKVDTLTLKYLDLLVNKGRESYLSEIAAEFNEQYKTLKKTTSVRVTTAAPITDELMAEIKSKILASGATSINLDIETKIDPALIGGFVLEFDNKRYDASVAYKLEQLKAQFTKNLYVKEI